MNNYKQYIGARYVPIFVGEWNRNISYEPLSIVSYNGDSYTSKTYVPVDAAISDTRYWVLSGKWNATLEQIREDVNRLTNRCIVTVGDSWSQGYVVRDGDTTGYPVLAKSMLQMRDDNFLILGHDGAGANLALNWNYKKVIDEATVSSSFAKRVTDVYIAGGLNDRSYVPAAKTAVTDGIKAAISSARSKFPNAAIHIVPIGYSMNTDTIERLLQVWEAYQAGAVTGGASFHGDWIGYFYRQSYMENENHPNQSGQYAAARFLVNVINGGVSVASDTDLISWTPAGQSASQLMGRVVRNNDGVFIASAGHALIQVSCSADFGNVIQNGTAGVNIGTWTCSVLNGADSGIGASIWVSGWASVVASHTWEPIAGELRFKRDHTIEFHPLHISGNTGYASFGVIDRITFHFFRCMMPFYS